MTVDDSKPPHAADDELDSWLQEDEPPPRRAGVTMRHPFLLVFVVAASGFLSVQTFRRVRHLFALQEVLECGDLSERPLVRAETPDKLRPLPHDRWCTLTGVVSSPVTLATGEPAETADPYAKHADRKFYVRLSGDKVWAVVSGNSRDLVNHRLRQASLFGYQVRGEGLMLDPSQDPRLRQTAEVLKVKWGEARDSQIRIFDTTRTRKSPWPYVLMLGALVFTALLGLYGLVRLALRRREGSLNGA